MVTVNALDGWFSDLEHHTSRDVLGQKCSAEPLSSSVCPWMGCETSTGAGRFFAKVDPKQDVQIRLSSLWNGFLQGYSFGV